MTNDNLPGVLAQIAEYRRITRPSGHDRIEVKGRERMKQIQVYDEERYDDGTFVRAMRWQTVASNEV
jgi:hypothetical protein